MTMSPAEIIQFMKTNKVLSYEYDGVKVTLHPDAFIPEAPKGEVEHGGPDLDERGSTGMSRREQMDLLGRVYESDFKKGVR